MNRPSNTINIAFWPETMEEWVKLNIPEIEASTICNQLITDCQKLVKEMIEPDVHMFTQGCHYNIIMSAFRKDVYGKTNSLAIDFFTDACVNYVMFYAR